MSITQNILTKPTFDLTDWEITSSMPDERIIFCESAQVFQFDKCKGNLMLRSRALRRYTEESELVENVISAVIDSGFCGKLVWKMKMSEDFFYNFLEEIGNLYSFDFNSKKEIVNKFQKLIQNSIQIDLNPFPTNYYNGTNQTGLEPDVIFTNGNSPVETLEKEKIYYTENPLTGERTQISEKEYLECQESARLSILEAQYKRYKMSCGDFSPNREKIRNLYYKIRSNYNESDVDELHKLISKEPTRYIDFPNRK